MLANRPFGRLPARRQFAAAGSFSARILIFKFLNSLNFKISQSTWCGGERSPSKVSAYWKLRSAQRIAEWLGFGAPDCPATLLEQFVHIEIQLTGVRKAADASLAGQPPLHVATWLHCDCLPPRSPCYMIYKPSGHLMRSEKSQRTLFNEQAV